RHPPRSPLLPYTTLFRSASFASFGIRPVDVLLSWPLLTSWRTRRSLTPSSEATSVWRYEGLLFGSSGYVGYSGRLFRGGFLVPRSEEHTSELESPDHLVG